jgi:cytidine deaminase
MSSSIARQVGAAIMDKQGGVIATGTNEAPYFQGGVCSEDSGTNSREYAMGFDSNTKHKKGILGNFIQLLQNEKWIPEKENKEVQELVDEFLSNPNLKNAKLMNITEFGREVHAEMTALMEASRKTIAVKNCALYCTTFPCHVCAKHIVTAGLEKVVFIEPYPKSMAEELFRDSINVDKKSDGEDKIEFNPFVGIAPRRYMDVFKWNDRKQNSSEKIDWDNSIKQPRFGDNPIAISTNEENQTVIFLEKRERLSKSEI